jgi:two-component system, NarL family, invasion response regulator UvrY
MIRILIGDDHRIVRAGLKQVLAESPDMSVVAEAATGPQVLEQVQLHNSLEGLDLVLLDIALPGMDGLEVLQQLRKEHPGLPVLMLSTYPESQYAVRCIRLGAGGYLNKSADPDDMLAAVRQVASGGRYLSHATAEALANAISPVGVGLQSLSHREHQVYRLLIAGQTVTQIGAQLGLAPNTVSTYRARILEKTGAKNDIELALLAERQSRSQTERSNPA